MPITEHVAGLVAGEMTPNEMLTRLISRATKSERD